MAPAMSVLDNVFLGVEMTRAATLDRRSQRRRFRELADRVGYQGDPGQEVGQLRVADQQQVAVMRALAREARLIVMDEPTAALSRVESQRLLELARQLRSEGVTIVYVSHMLDDVLLLSDTVSVLKDGRHVKTGPAAEESVDTLVTAMLGRSLDAVFPVRTPPPADAPVVLSVRGLTREPAIHDVEFDIRAGEIVGLAGLVGSGRTEIARAIFGADRADGVVTLDGRNLRRRSPRQAIRHGMALVPESRKDEGLAMHRPIFENVSMAHLDQVSRAGVVQRGRERRVVDEALRQVDARAATVKMDVSGLSGGNQQKVALAKWLVKPPRVLIVDEPTRGVDMGARRAIYELITELSRQGVAVLVISSQLEEVMGLAHRVLVVHRGRIVAEFAGDQIQEERILRASFGSLRAPDDERNSEEQT